MRARIWWAWVLLALVLGIWLRWHAQYAGFVGDDAVQIAMLRGEFPAPRHFLDLFRFADNERDGLALMEFGYDAWWTAPNLRIAMFRPLASALFALDYELFGLNSLPFHAHSALWWIATVVAAALVFRETLGPIAATVALFLFVVEEAHSAPVAWLANRSTLISCTFAFLGLYFHVRQRRRPIRRGPVYEGLFYALALLGGEYALSVMVYALVAVLLEKNRTDEERFRLALPALSALVMFFVLRAVFHFGVRGSGLYISPAGDLAAFVSAAMTRVPALAGDLVFGIPARWWVDRWYWQNVQLAYGAGAIALFGIVTYVLYRRDSANGRAALWFGLGALASLVPAAGALPEDRLLVAAALGSSAVFGSIVEHAWTNRRNTGVARLGFLGWTALSVAVFYQHGYEAAFRSLHQIRGFAGGSIAHRRWARAAELPTEGAQNKRVIFLSGADFTTNANLPFMRALEGYPMPKSYFRLSGTSHVQEIRRTGPNEIEVYALSSDLDKTMVGSLYRSEKQKLPLGKVVELSWVRIEVLGTTEGNPWRMRFTFDKTLDDPSFVLVHAREGGLKQLPFPPVGGKVRLPQPEWPR